MKPTAANRSISANASGSNLGHASPGKESGEDTVLLVVSTDAAWAEPMRTHLAPRCEVRVVSSVDAARMEIRDTEPWGIVADFRMLRGSGGHLEDRFLEEMHDRYPEMFIGAAISNDCPEPLERRLALSAIPQFREPVDSAALAQHLASRLGPTLPEPVPTPTPMQVESISVRPLPTATPDADFVLSGLTRRFETNTPRLRMMLADLEVAARHDVTVLLIGETGSGKTFLSKLIHEISPRRTEPFLPLACGALPADLIESELFGHVKGAFTSAHADKDGKFVAARRGTILLDEIDVLGLEQQVKLLRVIESGEFEPVGSNRTQKSEARLIVASNLDLQPLVEKGRFRPDLYYRLNMLKFEIPPLRARKPDIVPLARKFVAEQSAKHGVAIHRIDESLFNALLRYPWPGNVRELEHVIQRAVIYCRDGILSAQHMPAHVVMCVAGPGNDGQLVMDRPGMEDVTSNSLGQQVAFSEREIIEQALFKNNNSRTNTARALGISRVTLYNKMKKYGMTK